MKQLVFILSALFFSSHSFADSITILGVTYCKNSGKLENKAATADMMKYLVGKAFTHNLEIYESGGSLAEKEKPYTNTTEIASGANLFAHINDERLIYPTEIAVLNSKTILVNREHVMGFTLKGCDGVRFTLWNDLDNPKHSRFFGTLIKTEKGFNLCGGNYVDCQRAPKDGEYKYTQVFKFK